MTSFLEWQVLYNSKYRMMKAAASILSIKMLRKAMYEGIYWQLKNKNYIFLSGMKSEVNSRLQYQSVHKTLKHL